MNDTKIMTSAQKCIMIFAAILILLSFDLLNIVYSAVKIAESIANVIEIYKPIDIALTCQILFHPV